MTQTLTNTSIGDSGGWRCSRQNSYKGRVYERSRVEEVKSITTVTKEMEKLRFRFLWNFYRKSQERTNVFTIYK